VTGELGSRYLTLERRGPIAWVTMDRPEARNALTSSMYFGIRRAVELVEADDDLAALVLTGTGDVFAPGGDLGHRDEAPLPAGVSIDAAMPFTTLRSTRVPVVAAVNGICQAGGLLIALLCDVAVASDRATFRSPELLRGFAEMWYAAVLPAHVGLARARDFCLTGRKLDARQAEGWGMVARVVPHEELEFEAERIAYQLLEAAPFARALWKSAANARYGVVDETTFTLQRDSGEWLEGSQAFMERRPPLWSRGGPARHGR